MSTDFEKIKFSLRVLFIVACIAMLIDIPYARGQAAPTPPVNVPDASSLATSDDNMALKQSLDLRYADLLQRYQTWNQQAQAYNSQYASKNMDPDSPEYAAGRAKLAQLSQALTSYNSDNAAFADDVAKLVPKPAPPPMSPMPIPPSDGPHSGPFDSRTLITMDEYQDAVKKEQDLLKEQSRCQNELAKLQDWQQGLQKDTDEFSKIQRDAQIDCLHDVLMNIPASETFEKMADLKYLTSDQAGALSAGYDALKGLVSSAEGIDAENSQEQLEKILEAQKNFRDSMTDQAMMALKESNPKAFEWYGNVGKTLDAARELIVFSQQNDQSIQSWGKLGVKLGTAVVPLANYVVIADTLGEKLGTQYVVQAPLQSLGEAMSKNFEAHRYWQGKLDSVNYALSGVQETIKNYQAVHKQGE